MESNKKTALGLIGGAILSLFGGSLVYLITMYFLRPLAIEAIDTGNLLFPAILAILILWLVNSFVSGLTNNKLKKFVTIKFPAVDNFIPIYSAIKFKELYYKMVTVRLIEDRTGEIPKGSNKFKSNLAKVLGHLGLASNIINILFFIIGGIFVIVKYGGYALLNQHTIFLFVFAILYFINITIRSIQISLIIQAYKGYMKSSNPTNLSAIIGVLPIFLILNIVSILVIYFMGLKTNIPLFNILGFILLPALQTTVIRLCVKRSMTDVEETIIEAYKKRGKKPPVW